MYNFNISQFRAHMNKRGFLRNSHFTMYIPMPRGFSDDRDSNTKYSKTSEDLIFTIEASKLPGVQIATDEVRRYGIGNFEKKPTVPIFSDIDVLVICDREGKTYDFFQSWLKLIINYDFGKSINGDTGVTRNQQLPYELTYKEDYAVDALITCYDQEGKESIKIKLLDMYPIFLGDVVLSWSDTNSIIRLPVSFTFRDWRQDVENTKDDRRGNELGVASNTPRNRAVESGNAIR